MSSNDQNSNQSSSPPNRRRASFVDMFNPRGSVSSQNQTPGGPRRLSITTLGLSTIPGAQTSPFNNIRNRTESVSSANSGSVDESPFEDDSNGSPSNNTAASVPVTPYGRRMSFGAARALRGVTSGNQNGANGNGQNEGYDFAEQMRQRAERGSIASGSFPMASPIQTAPIHQRSKSIATMEPPKSELPKPAPRPDAFQERILKGDFYMD